MDTCRHIVNSAPRERVACLMAEVLGLETFATDQDFFGAGAHSLHATQLLLRIQQQFAVELPAHAVYQAPTPRTLAARIESAPGGSAAPIIPHTGRSGPTALSFAQERTWMLHQLDPAGSAYNVHAALWLDGALDPAILQRALDEVTSRHEVLRCNFTSIDGAPVATARPSIDVPLQICDLSAGPDAEATALASAESFAARPFDIETDVLIRAEIWKVAPRRHLLAACVHHLVSDVWAMALLFDELLRCYDSLAAGKRLDPAPGGIDYADYAAWERQWLDKKRLDADLAYWTAQLAGASPVELPTDLAPTGVKTSDGTFVPMDLPTGLFERLTALSRANHVTPFMTLCAAFAVLLQRHTGSHDLVIGIPIANRNQLACETMLGSFVNTLALRLRFDPERPFLELLRQVREASLDAFEHRQLPFDRLVSALPLERRAGESPLVSVMFDYQNAPVASSGTGPLRATPVGFGRGGAQFDLTLSVLDNGSANAIGVEYRTGLYQAATMQRLLGHYVVILEEIVRDPQRSPATMPLLSAAERSELLALAAPDRDPPGLGDEVPAAIARLARLDPARAAVHDEAGELSYGELERQAALLAARLQAVGVVDGERAAVLLERDHRLVVSLLAIQKCGAAYVPIDPSYPADRIGHVLDDSRPTVVVTLATLRAQLPEAWRGRCLCLDEPASQVLAAALAPAPAPRRDRIAYILYTSGSTGRPKGVEVPASALANFLRSMARAPGIRADDRVLALTTIAFDIAGLELWLPLTHGACLRMVPAATAADPLALSALMRSWRPTLMQATPATWKMLLTIDWKGDPGLRMLCGGEAMPPELAQTLLGLGAELWNMYGPTETTIWSTVHRVIPADTQRIPVGRPIDHTRIYVLDAHRQLQPRGVAGEIYIGGAGVAQGYFGRPDLTAERFLPDPFAGDPDARMYRTGDAGRLRPDGNLECLARLDDQIKLRGFRIEPGEIEAVFKEDARIRDAVVQAREIQPGDSRLVAWYVPVAMELATPEFEEQLRNHLQRRLPPYMIPSAIKALAALPSTPNGKTDRRALPTPRVERTADGESLVAPRDAIEQAIAEIWQELLGVPRVGVRDSFFALGGYSLLAMRMFARIHREFDVMLPPAVLFERPTIEHLAERVRGSAQPTGETSTRSASGMRFIASRPFDHLVAINASGNQGALFCVHGAGGNVYTFAALTERLGEQRPLFGIQARGVDGIHAPHGRIEAMAEAYIAEIREVQPHGPYLLAGYCGGGIIAFEMACRLRAAGEAVAMLAMIDCYRPGVTVAASRSQRLSEGLRNEGLRYLVRRSMVWLRRNAAELWARLGIALHRRIGRPVPFQLRDFWLTRSFMASADRWTPGHYDGRLVLLRASDMDPELVAVGPDLGWREYAADIHTYNVPGNHLNLLDAPNCDVLAARLAEELDEAEGHRAP